MTALDGIQVPLARPVLSAAEFTDWFRVIGDNVRRVIRGKDEVVDLALTCLLAEGHLLIEDVPGVGKTSIARAFAMSLGAVCQRIQFTPDLLPSDVTGVSVYNQRTQEFVFRPGPVFASIVLADEINRASPKTQSALLEVMEERQVTVDGVPRPVPRPFMVIATQNPVDMEGTYPLPEAQLDRFLMRVAVGYPAHAAEVDVLRGQDGRPVLGALSPVVDASHVHAMIATAARVHASEPLHDYIVHLVAATRRLPELRLGASPRGSVTLLRAARVWAAAAGRDFTTPEDVKAVAVPVLAHRLLLTPEAQVSGQTAKSVLERVLATTRVPANLDG